MNKLKEQIEEILMEYMKEYPATDVGVSCSALAGRIVHELTPQIDKGVSNDAKYLGAEIRWAGMTPLERAEAIELGWHPSNYLKEIKE